MQKGGAGTRLDYIEFPVLVGGAVESSSGLGARFYSGLAFAFTVACSSEVALACDSKKGSEFAWPLGMLHGRRTADRLVALDVRYSIGQSDAIDTTFASNRSWQFRAYVGFRVGG